MLIQYAIIHANLQEIQGKMDQLSIKVEEKLNPTYKVFDSELDFSKLAAAHIAPSS
jgi:hypothetical protein